MERQNCDLEVHKALEINISINPRMRTGVSKTPNPLKASPF